MFILKISNKAFVESVNDNQLVITTDYTKALQSEIIGDAMRLAITVNELLGKHLAKVTEL